MVFPVLHLTMLAIAQPEAEVLFATCYRPPINIALVLLHAFLFLKKSVFPTVLDGASFIPFPTSKKRRELNLSEVKITCQDNKASYWQNGNPDLGFPCPTDSACPPLPAGSLS